MEARSPNSAQRQEKYLSSAVRIFTLLLVTVFVLCLWMLVSMDAADAVATFSGVVPIRVGRTELLLVLVLLLLNILMAYGMFRRFSSEGIHVKTALGTIIVSLLAMSVWLGLRFLPAAEESTGLLKAPDMPSKLNGVEIAMAVVLLLASALSILLMIRSHLRAKPMLLMSAYSKKVHCRGRWMSIEEYLEKELGLNISHGMTPDEKTEAMEEFQKMSGQQELPYPRD